MNELWILLTAILVSVTCSIVGVFLILRKMSMIADAISHTVLFGIVMSYIMTHTLSGWSMFIGAVLTGIATAYIVQLLQTTGIQEDAAIGITFTVIFAVSVLLVTLFAGSVHLDVEHVLMGEIAFVPWERLTVGAVMMPKAVWILGFVLLLNIAFFGLFYRVMNVSTFDVSYAVTIGLPVVLIHYLFMTMVSLTTVAAFDSVGAILVVALLIGPPATAYLISRTVPQMFFWSISLGVISTVIGYVFATWLDTSISGMMATAVGFVFLVVLIVTKLQNRKLNAVGEGETAIGQ